MASKDELELESLKKEIENSYQLKEYENVVSLIEKAIPLCKKLYNSTLDVQRKKIMVDNANLWKRVRQQCLDKLDKTTLTVDSSSVKKVETKKENKKPTSPTKKDNDQKKQNEKTSDGDVEYMINGVDVKPFIITDANDVVTFNDVIGMEKEKEIISNEFFLSDEEREFNRYLNKKEKTFILLYGVPGTGKTFFAKAISQELKNKLGEDVPFFSVVGSQLSDCKVGQSEKNIQAIFEFCKQFERCVLFIDEFDSLAPDRKIATGDPTAQSRVTTLIQMMDGFSSSKGTLLIAATNCPYNLDGAVLSRANVRIEIPLPNYEVIYLTLKKKIGDKCAENVDLSALAVKLDGYSNRDIKNFIEDLNGCLFNEFKKERSLGNSQPIENFKFTNEMIMSTLKTIQPTTKASDLKRIEKFKNAGE